LSYAERLKAVSVHSSILGEAYASEICPLSLRGYLTTYVSPSFGDTPNGHAFSETLFDDHPLLSFVNLCWVLCVHPILVCVCTRLKLVCGQVAILSELASCSVRRSVPSNVFRSPKQRVDKCRSRV
jgi:hypothetical protein